jgi:hypothetical protein
MFKTWIISVVFFLAMLANIGVLAAETTKYQIAFLGGKNTIEFTEVESQDREAIVVTISSSIKPSGGKIYVDRYETEGGSIPKIASVFVSGSAPRKLFIIVDWAADAPSIGTGGSLYQVYVYDENIESKDNIKRLIPDLALMKRFGIGLDGTREGQRVTYRFKTARSIKKQLADWGYK